MANAFVVAGEVGAECDSTFVVDVEWRRVELWESEFGEYVAKEDNIFRGLCCGVGFTLSGAECGGLLFLAGSVELASRFVSVGEACARVGLASVRTTRLVAPAKWCG